MIPGFREWQRLTFSHGIAGQKESAFLTKLHGMQRLPGFGVYGYDTLTLIVPLSDLDSMALF